MITLISPAEARLQASIQTKTSIKCSVTGVQVDWTIKTERPRTDSCGSTKISPSAKCSTLIFPKGICNASQMADARLVLEVSANTTVSFNMGAISLLN